MLVFACVVFHVFPFFFHFISRSFHALIEKFFSLVFSSLSHCMDFTFNHFFTFHFLLLMSFLEVDITNLLLIYGSGAPISQFTLIQHR